jgi:hypothetical protein
MAQLQAASGKEQWRTAKKGHGSRSRLARLRGVRGLSESRSRAGTRVAEKHHQHQATCLHVAAACARECGVRLDVIASSRDRRESRARSSAAGRRDSGQVCSLCQCAVGPWEARAREKYFYNNIHRAQGQGVSPGRRGRRSTECAAPHSDSVHTTELRCTCSI